MKNLSIRERLSQKPLMTVFVVKTVMGRYIKVNDSNSPNIEDARAFSSYDEAEKYINSRMFPIFLSIAKVNLNRFYDEDTDTDLESEDKNPDEFSLPRWKLEDKAEANRH